MNKSLPRIRARFGVSRLLCWGSLIAAAFWVGNGGMTLTVYAEVEAVAIDLITGDDQEENRSYTVPDGKVLVVEHVMFGNTFGTGRNFVVNHATGSGDPWRTTLGFNSNFNSLFRPLKLPEGTTVSLQPSDNRVPQVMHLYGLLVTEDELFASVGTDVDQFEVSREGENRVIRGRLDLGTSRPARIRARSGEEVTKLEKDPEVEVGVSSETSAGRHNFEKIVSAEQKRLFMEFSARVKPDEGPVSGGQGSTAGSVIGVFTKKCG